MANEFDLDVLIGVTPSATPVQPVNAPMAPAPVAPKTPQDFNLDDLITPTQPISSAPSLSGASSQGAAVPAVPPAPTALPSVPPSPTGVFLKEAAAGLGRGLMTTGGVLASGLRGVAQLLVPNTIQFDKSVPRIDRLIREELNKPSAPEEFVNGLNKQSFEDTLKEGGAAPAIAQQVGQDIFKSFYDTALILGGSAAVGKVGAPLPVIGSKPLSFLPATRQAINVAGPEAMKFAGFTFLTTPGETQERAKAAGESMAMILAPAMTAGFSSPTLSKVASFAALTGLTTLPNMKETVESAQEMADQTGVPFETALASKLSVGTLMNLLFSATSHSIPAQQRQHIEQRRADLVQSIRAENPQLTDQVQRFIVERNRLAQERKLDFADQAAQGKAPEEAGRSAEVQAGLAMRPETPISAKPEETIQTPTGLPLTRPEPQIAPPEGVLEPKKDVSGDIPPVKPEITPEEATGLPLKPETQPPVQPARNINPLAKEATNLDQGKTLEPETDFKGEQALRPEAQIPAPEKALTATPLQEGKVPAETVKQEPIKEAGVISEEAKHPIERIEGVADKHGFELVYPDDSRAVKIGGSTYPTLITKDGKVRVALDPATLFIRKDRSDVYLGDPSEYSPTQIQMAGIIVNPMARGKKLGSKAVDAVSAMADELGMTVQAEPTPIKSATPKGAKALTQKQLVSFYKRHGWAEERPGDERILSRPPTERKGLTPEQGKTTIEGANEKTTVSKPAEEQRNTPSDAGGQKEPAGVGPNREPVQPGRERAYDNNHTQGRALGEPPEGASPAVVEKRVHNVKTYFATDAKTVDGFGDRAADDSVRKQFESAGYNVVTAQHGKSAGDAMTFKTEKTVYFDGNYKNREHEFFHVRVNNGDKAALKHLQDTKDTVTKEQVASYRAGAEQSGVKLSDEAAIEDIAADKYQASISGKGFMRHGVAFEANPETAKAMEIKAPETGKTAEGKAPEKETGPPAREQWSKSPSGSSGEDVKFAIHPKQVPEEGSEEFKKWTRGIPKQARRDMGLLYGFVNKVGDAQGDIIRRFGTTKDLNQSLSKSPALRERMVELRKDMKAQGHNYKWITEDGKLVSEMFEMINPDFKPFKIPRSIMQRVVDALSPVEVSSKYKLPDGREIDIGDGKRDTVMAPGGEAMRQSILQLTRDLYKDGKLSEVDAATSLKKDDYGTMGFLTNNDKTLASGDFTTMCPQMMFNRGCWYCYRKAQLVDKVNIKLAAQRVWYTGDILRMSDKLVKELNGVGGLRIQSFGDWFENGEHSRQLVDVLTDAKERGLQVKIITKDPALVRLIAHLKDQGAADNVFMNLSVDRFAERAGLIQPGPNAPAPLNAERPFFKTEAGEAYWKRALTTTEAINEFGRYPWVNVRSVEAGVDGFVKALQNQNIQVVTGYHGHERGKNVELIDTETGKKMVEIEPLGDNGMPRFSCSTGKLLYAGKTRFHQALAKEIQRLDLGKVYQRKSCCIYGKCESCKTLCGSGGREKLEAIKSDSQFDKWLIKNADMPEQPKMAREEKEETAPAFYSQLERVIEQKMPVRTSVQQLRNMVDPGKGSGVKADEIYWSGLKDFLDLKKPDGEFAIVDDRGVIWSQLFDTRAEAERAMATGSGFNQERPSGPTVATVHTLDVTPSMRDSVLKEGQPLFARGPMEPPPEKGKAAEKIEDKSVRDPDYWKQAAAKNEFMDAVVERMGGKVEKSAPRTNEALLERAYKELELNPNAADHIVERFKEDPKAQLADYEEVILAHAGLHADKEFETALRNAKVLRKSGDTHSIADNNTRMEAARLRGMAIAKTLRQTGTRASYALSARQLFVDENLTLLRRMEIIESAQDGKSLSKEQSDFVQQLHERVQKLKADYDKVVAERDALKEERKPDDELMTILKEVTKRLSNPATEKLVDADYASAMEFLKQPPAEAKELLEGVKMAVEDRGSAYAAIGARYLKNFDSRETWEKAVSRDLKGQPNVDLNRIFKDAIRHRAGLYEIATPKAQRPRQIKVRDLSDLKNLPALVRVYVRDEIANGNTKLDGVLPAVLERINAMRPDITMRQVQDAWTGRGKEALPKREPTKVEITMDDLLAQQKALDKLEEIRSGEFNKIERTKRVPSLELQELNRQVKDAMKRMGLIVTDPAKQLDIYKKRLRKAIDEKVARMERGEFETPKKISGMKLDSEALALRDEMDRVSEEFQDMKWRAKEAPDKWIGLMDKYLEERKEKLPGDVRKEVEKGFRDAFQIDDKAARDLALSGVVNRINEFVPIKKGDWFDAYVYTNMLSSPGAHERNTWSNMINAIITRPMTLAFQGEFGQAGTYLGKALQTAFSREAISAATEAFRNGEMTKHMETFASGPELSTFAKAKLVHGPENAVANRAWKTLTTVGRALNAEDVYFSKIIEVAETARLMEQGMPLDAARANAKTLADQYLYRDKLSTKMDESIDPINKSLEWMAAKMDEVRKSPHALIRIPAKLTVPFLKVPVKVAQFNNSLSPLSYWSANKNRIARAHYKTTYDQMKVELTGQLESATPDVARVKALREQISEVDAVSKERVGKARLGTALTALGWACAAAGMVTWNPPQDEKAKKLFYDAGYKPYSLNIFGRSIPLMYLGPAMLAFAIPGAFYNVLRDNPENRHDEISWKVAKLAFAIPQMIVNQLPVQGVANWMNTVLGQRDMDLPRTVGAYGTQVVPLSGALRWINNFVDEKYRQPQTVGETVMAGIPGLSQFVKARKDSENIDAKKSFWDALAPYKIGKLKPGKQAELRERFRKIEENKRISKDKKLQQMLK